MLGRPLGNGEAKVVYRGYGCRIGHQLGAVEAREVQWGNGSKIKNVLALDGFPDLYRRVSLAMACQKLKWVPLVLQGNYWDS